MRGRRLQRVDRAGARIYKNAWARNDLSVLRRRERNFDHLDSKQRRVWIFVRCSAGTSGQFFVLSDEGCPRDINVDVVFVIRIDDQSMGVRSSAGLYRRNLSGIFDIRDVEDP